MDKQIRAVIMLNNDPMLGIKDNKIVVYNTSAEKLFGNLYSGKKAINTIPEVLLSAKSDNFVATVEIDRINYSVNASAVDEMLIIAFSDISGKNSATVLLNEVTLSNLNSTAFNMQLTIQRLVRILNEDLNPKIEQYMTILNRSYYKLQHDISNLTMAYNIFNDNFVCIASHVDLAKMCSELVDTASHLLSTHSIELNFSTELGELYANIDRDRIQILLLNLISNSFAHTPKGGRVNVTLSTQGDNAVFSVSDNGYGIDDATMQNLFSWNRTQDAKSLSETLTGSGLGLFIASTIAQKHFGSLVIESRVGTGTCVRVLLPLSRQDSLGLRSDYIDKDMASIDLFLTHLAPLLDSEFFREAYMD